MGLSHFIDRFKGATGWIFGKGPSLSQFNFNQAGDLRFAINDVAAHVPDCRFCFSNDGVKKWSDCYSEGQTLFQPTRCLWEYDSTKPGAVAADVVTFKDDHDIPIQVDREVLAECLDIRRGTLGSALQIIHLMGVSTLYAVGFDGGHAHAPGINWRTRLRADHAKDYNSIRSQAIETASELGLKFYFINPLTNMKTDGKIKVKFIRNALAQGVHFYAGQEESFAPEVAGDLIGAAAAVQIGVTPETPIKETASAPLKAAENASIETKKASLSSPKKAAKKSGKK